MKRAIAILGIMVLLRGGYMAFFPDATHTEYRKVLYGEEVTVQNVIMRGDVEMERIPVDLIDKDVRFDADDLPSNHEVEPEGDAREW
ncbi:MAG: hypothetical protein WC455_17445 [Dehalococcoidia bacterium]|jgi:hypothetical protein